MSGINSVKNYKHSILLKKIGVLKRLKKRRKKVCWHRQLYILLVKQHRCIKPGLTTDKYSIYFLKWYVFEHSA